MRSEREQGRWEGALFAAIYMWVLVAATYSVQASNTCRKTCAFHIGVLHSDWSCTCMVPVEGR